MFPAYPPARNESGPFRQGSAFTIPAGHPNHEGRAHHVFTEDVLVRSVAPHMRYRGKDMTYTAHLPEGTKRELLSVSRYDFNWQTAYEFVEPVALPAGTRMEVRRGLAGGYRALPGLRA